jgi:hypothetical protein
MGCDAFANSEGVFTIKVSDYDEGTFEKSFKLTGLKPRHKISIEIVEGDWR